MALFSSSSWHQLLVAFKQQLTSFCLMLSILLMAWWVIPIVEPLVEDWATLQYVKPTANNDNTTLPFNTSTSKNPTPISVITVIDNESIEKLEKQYGSYPWNTQSYQKMLATLEAWYHPSAISLTKPLSKATQNTLIINASARVTQALKPWQVEGLAKDVFETPLSIGELPPLTSNGINNTNTIEHKLTERRRFKLLWEFPNSTLSEKRLPSLALSTVLKHFDADELENKSVYALETNLFANAGSQSIKIRPGQKNASPPPVIQTAASYEFQPVWYPILGKTPQGFVFTHPTLPLWRLLEHRDMGLMKKLRGVPLLVGYTNAADADSLPTTLHSHQLLADVHATLIDNILQGNTITPALDWQQWTFFTVFFVLMLGFRLIDKTVWQSPTVATILSIGYLAFCIGSLSVLHTMFQWVTPLYAILAGLLVGEWYRQFQRERALVMMESNLAQLVSPTVLKQIVKRKEKLEAGGRRIIITSMFVDIREFTKISESLSPSEVTDMLNAWYTQVERIVTEYRGTVDKYLGDGALVMFGAPMETNQHADMAIKAARHLVKASQTFAESWNQKSRIPFSIGISINSGAAFVGFVGPSEKLEYTAIGDTVNTSSRLQDQAKIFKTVLIFSETTLRTCTNMNMDVPVVPLGEVSIRGKETLVNVFTFADMFITPPIHSPLENNTTEAQLVLNPPATATTTLPEVVPASFAFTGSFQQPPAPIVMATPFPTPEATLPTAAFPITAQGASTMGNNSSTMPVATPFPAVPTAMAFSQQAPTLPMVLPPPPEVPETIGNTSPTPAIPIILNGWMPLPPPLTTGIPTPVLTETATTPVPINPTSSFRLPPKEASPFQKLSAEGMVDKTQKPNPFTIKKPPFQF
jgi:class 3 adenylate cyclase